MGHCATMAPTNGAVRNTEMRVWLRPADAAYTAPMPIRPPAAAPVKNDETTPVGTVCASFRRPIGSGTDSGGALAADRVTGTSESETSTDASTNRRKPLSSSMFSMSCPTERLPMVTIM